MQAAAETTVNDFVLLKIIQGRLNSTNALRKGYRKDFLYYV
jgi:hypothetical protein